MELYYQVWENKVREARLTYDLALWYTRNPSRDVTEMEPDSSSDYNVNLPSTSKPVTILVHGTWIMSKVKGTQFAWRLFSNALLCIRA